MKATTGVWGLDLGQCALKALRLQEIDGQMVATAFDFIEHPKILSQPDADPDQLTREALEKFLSRNTVKGDIVCISVPGQAGLARFVKLPPVEEKKISDIVRFEAKQQIPFNLEEVVWDYQKIGAGTVMDGFAMDTEIGLFAMKRDMINKYLDHFKGVNVDVHVIQMAPLALCNYAAYDLLNKDIVSAPVDPEAGNEEESSNSVVLLDIGTDSSNLVITDGNKIIWQRPIPLGGNHFTRALTKDLKLTFTKAEHLKRNATKSPDLRNILTALKPVLNDFVGEVQRSLGFFNNTHRDVEIQSIVGLGNAFRLPGLQRFLEEKLSVKVVKLQKLERLAGDAVLTAPAWNENVMSFAVAYGLALQGMKRTRLLTNLLPPEIQMDRLIKSKKPWAAATAACLLLGLGGALAGTSLSYQSYATPAVKDAIASVKKQSEEASSAKSKFEAAKKAGLDEEASVNSIVAGQGEFTNWLELLHYLSISVPQPSGENLTPTAFQKYFAQAFQPLDGEKPIIPPMTGQEAFQNYINHVSESSVTLGGNPGAVQDLGKGVDDRIQVNIEAVDCRYTDDLTQFWEKARENSRPKLDIGNVRSTKIKMNSNGGKEIEPPSGKGWVVEIRGYTFHRGERQFLMDTFITNLLEKANPDFKVGSPPPAAPAPAGEKPAAGSTTPATQPGKPAAAPAAGKDPANNKTAPAGQPDKTPAGPAGKPLATPETKAPAAPSADQHPIHNKISHVILYPFESTKTSDNQSFSHISSSLLDTLLKSGGRQGPGGPPGMPGGMGGGPPPGQGGGGPGGNNSAMMSEYGKEMGSGGAPAGGGGPPAGGPPAAGPGAGAKGAPKAGANVPAVINRDNWVPLGTTSAPTSRGSGRGGYPNGQGGNSTPASGKTDTNLPPSPHQRTEFIILLTWAEPTPTDPDAPTGGASGGRPGAQGGGRPGRGGPPGGPGGPPGGPGGKPGGPPAGGN